MKEQWVAMEPARQTGDRLLESWPLAGDEMPSPPGKGGPKPKPPASPIRVAGGRGGGGASL